MKKWIVLTVLSLIFISIISVILLNKHKGNILRIHSSVFSDPTQNAYLIDSIKSHLGNPSEERIFVIHVNDQPNLFEAPLYRILRADLIKYDSLDICYCEWRYSNYIVSYWFCKKNSDWRSVRNLRWNKDVRF